MDEFEGRLVCEIELSADFCLDDDIKQSRASLQNHVSDNQAQKAKSEMSSNADCYPEFQALMGRVHHHHLSLSKKLR